VFVKGFNGQNFQVTFLKHVFLRFVIF